MAGQPFISKRKYIKWGDAEAAENTDTLVLTSRKKYFVDVRIYLPTTSTEASLPTSELLPISRLEWGFAGTSKSTPAQFSKDQPPKLEKPAHSEWTHWVDNKTLEEVRDDGDMYPQDNGEVLELGAMVNPASGKVEKYEEVWIDLDPELVGDEKDFVSWVLRTEGSATNPETAVKGLIIRVGDWVQCVVRRGDDVFVRRWRWDSDSGWVTVVNIGNVQFPETSLSNTFQENDKLADIDGLAWVCVESFSWN